MAESAIVLYLRTLRGEVELWCSGDREGSLGFHERFIRERVEEASVYEQLNAAEIGRRWGRMSKESQEIAREGKALALVIMGRRPSGQDASDDEKVRAARIGIGFALVAENREKKPPKRGV